jgi:hypothetical protein
MMKKLQMGIAAAAIAFGVGLAPTAEAQFFASPAPGFPTTFQGAIGPFGNPVSPVGIFENTSSGTPFAATIARNGNIFSNLFPAAGLPLFQNAQRLGNGLVNAGFEPTSRARWSFIP